MPALGLAHPHGHDRVAQPLHRRAAGGDGWPPDHRNAHRRGFGRRASGSRARPRPASLGILGSGVQARSHIEALRLVRPALTDIRIWSRTAAHAQRLAEETGARAVAIEEACAADVVLTVTASPEPVLQGRWLAPHSAGAGRGRGRRAPARTGRRGHAGRIPRGRVPLRASSANPETSSSPAPKSRPRSAKSWPLLNPSPQPPPAASSSSPSEWPLKTWSPPVWSGRPTPPAQNSTRTEAASRIGRGLGSSPLQPSQSLSFRGILFKADQHSPESSAACGHL